MGDKGKMWIAELLQRRVRDVETHDNGKVFTVWELLGSEDGRIFAESDGEGCIKKTNKHCSDKYSDKLRIYERQRNNVWNSVVRRI